MRQVSGTIVVTAPRQGLSLITDAVTAWVAEQAMQEGASTCASTGGNQVHARSRRI
jgi:thiamine phosphate synthase YjbQ (UPF0047 family)